MENVQTLEPGTLLRLYRASILQIAQQHGASNVRVFGSMARGKATAGSDLDLLVDFAPDRSLFDHVGLIQDLEDLLGIRVDVVTPAGLHPLIRDDVMEYAIPL